MKVIQMLVFISVISNSQYVDWPSRNPWDCIDENLTLGVLATSKDGGSLKLLCNCFTGPECLTAGIFMREENFYCLIIVNLDRLCMQLNLILT